MSTDVTNTPADPSLDPPVPDKLSIPWWTRGDLNAFFGLGFNILVNVLTLTGLMIGVIAVPAGDVLGTVLPALGVALILGNLYYTFLARRLARRENRTDVTALPYGPSVPHMFIVIFVVMLPVYLNTDDPIQAWQAGLAWAFLIGVIVMVGAFVGPYIRKLTPRAAMLGTLAGISITFISMRPAAQMWEVAWIGLPVMAIILIGFFTNMKLPGNVPVSLVALLVRNRDPGGPVATCRHPMWDRRFPTSPSASRTCGSTCSSMGLPTSLPCWEPRFRSASTTSPRR